MMVVCGVLLFLPLFWRLFHLMILEHSHYESAAITNQTRSTAIVADRGTIYDCNLNILAASKTVENVFIDPWEIHNSKEDVDLIAEGLGEILEIDPDSIREKAARLDRRYEVIARKRELEQSNAVRAFITEHELVGIHLESDSQRYYPSGCTPAQVIGFTNSENRGGEGLEEYYDDVLQGTSGAVITTKGNYETQMLYSYEKYYDASDGNSLVLTIDSTVQLFLEKNIKAAIEKYDVKNGAFAVMMDVNTGAILGMAIEGSYDPNHYLEIMDLSVLEQLDEISKQKEQAAGDLEQLNKLTAEYNQIEAAARLKQWRNRCVSDGYEPGSTFKTITLAAALEEKAVDLDTTTFFCAGAKNYKDRASTLHCWKDGGHGSETLAQALQNSCNIAFADIGMLLGGSKLYDYIDALGLLEKTGIDMAGESTGVFHSREMLMENAQLTTVAFGQSVKPTPIQMVRAIAAVVNGGYVLKPYVVSEILDENGNVIQKNGKTVIRQALSKETSKIMCELIESVVTNGTAGNAKLSGYRIGGKTGTSEKLDEYVDGVQTQDRIVSFVGIAPMDDPQYICLVALDSPSRETGIYVSGGVMAAPVVRDIFAEALPYLGVQPDYSDVDMSSVNVSMPDVRYMSEEEAKEILSKRSLSYTTVGPGDEITAQIPLPNELLPGNSSVILYLGEPAPTDLVTVPDVRNMTEEQAKAAIEERGLYMQTKGSSLFSVVTDQDHEPGEQVHRGTTVTVELTDQTALD